MVLNVKQYAQVQKQEQIALSKKFEFSRKDNIGRI